MLKEHNTPHVLNTCFKHVRDMPTALSAVDPNIAAYMFPTQPANSTKRATAAIESSE